MKPPCAASLTMLQCAEQIQQENNSQVFWESLKVRMSGSQKVFAYSIIYFLF